MGAGKLATTWTTGWSSAGEARREPDGQPGRERPERAERDRQEDPPQRGARRGQGGEPRLAPGTWRSRRTSSGRAEPEQGEQPGEEDERERRAPPPPGALCRRPRAAARRGGRGARADAAAAPAAHREPPARRECAGGRGTRSGPPRPRLPLVLPELLRPDHHRPPEELVERHDHEGHGHHRRGHGPPVARAPPPRSCRRPGPAAGSRALPSTKASLTMRKNQPPAIDIMEFQMRPMTEAGSSTR